MEDEELVKIYNSILKMKEIILFLLIVVINELMCIDSNIELALVTKFSQPKLKSA